MRDNICLGPSDRPYDPSFLPSELAWIDSALERAGVPFSNPQQPLRYWGLMYSALKYVWEKTRDINATVAQLLVELGIPDECASQFAIEGVDFKQYAVGLNTRAAFVRECLAANIDFTSGLAKLASVDSLPAIPALVLHAQGLIDISRLVNIKRCGQLAPYLCSISTPISVELLDEGKARDVSSPLFWLGVAPRALQPEVERAILEAGDEEASSLARGLVAGAWRARPLLGFDPARGVDHWPSRLSTARHALSVLERRLTEKPSVTSSCVRRAVLEIQSRIINMSRGTPEPSSVAVRNIASYELACVRGVLGNSSDADVTQTLDDSTRVLIEAAFQALRSGDSTWAALKPALRLLRFSPVPTLAPDLRYWCVRRTPPADKPESASSHLRPIPEMPDPSEQWAFIPAHIADCIHQIKDEEVDEDVGLLHLRTSFARYCLDQLVSKERGGPPIEPSSQWRRGYLDALDALRVNPQGKGHRVIRYVADSDPDPAVREKAASIFNKVRGGPQLGKKSPRVACFHAIWHLFRAHMMQLDIDVDDRAAESTRELMIRRTTAPKQAGEEDLHLM